MLRDTLQINVEKWIEHPDFVGRTPVRNDIALIRLEEPVTLSRSVMPVCLPLDPKATKEALGVSDLTQGLLGVKSTLIGWGRTSARDLGSISVSLICCRHETCPLTTISDNRGHHTSPAEG